MFQSGDPCLAEDNVAEAKDDDAEDSAARKIYIDD